jgi:hypothetical protein
MGFKQRERKRKQRAAMGSAQAESRRSGSSADKWWLTPLVSTTCCARCGLVLREGTDAVYRHTPREARCVRCADQDPASSSYRASARWEQANRRRRQKRIAA